jgi:predicted ATPase/DNA-binding CsgD family transcriptional regulator
MNARVSKTGEVLVEPLTRREREILVLVAQGYSAPEIAQRLTLALSSVKWYVQQVYGKLGVNNKQRAIIRAGELGLLETHSSVAYIHFSPKHNLPSQLTSFIGREKEIETVKHLLASHSGGKRSTPQSGSVDRLLTLTGAGGSGKTRLALEVATKLRDVFPDGVWFIDFAPLTDPALVPQTLLTTLGLREQADRSALAIVSDFLQRKRALLILDNCEHLIHACAQLVETLLHACPALHILATSREALRVAGEKLYLVPTLTTPNPAQADLDTLPQYEAVRLFVERAQTAWSGFRLTNDNALAVAQVCHQLDGIPLAIELAAARVKVLRVEQIASRLEDRFQLLISGARTDLPRHRTLHALIDWSHDMLSEPERVLFRRLAVFAGGWTLEAAESVCVGDGVEANAVLDLMTQLVNKSLILAEREQGKEARYRILETIRQYASERLLKAGEGEQLRNRHLDFFLRWAERVEPLVRGSQQLKWLDQLEAENDNLRAALEWGPTQSEHGEASLRLAGALPVFWYQRGYINEGLAWLEKVLASRTALHVGGVRAKALYGAGFLACWQGNRMGAARTWLEESARLWRMLGWSGRTGLAHTLATSSEAMRILGDPAAAHSLADEAAALCREQDDRWGLAYALTNLGTAISDQEDFALAGSTIDESVVLWREIGDLWGLVLATHRLGEAAMRQGDHEVARRHFMDYLGIVRKLGDQEQEAWKLCNLGSIALSLGDGAEAKAYTEESFNLFQKLGSKYGQSISYSNFGFLALIDDDDQLAQSFFEQSLELACTSGPVWLGAMALVGLAAAATSTQARRAARLLGAAEARLKAGASYWGGVEELCVGRVTDTAMAQLGETEFAAAQAEGWSMTFEQAANYALETEPSA